MSLVHRLLHRVYRQARRLKPGRLVGVRVIVTDIRGHVALVRHTYDPRWFLPGGGVDRGKTFHEAARSEMREELGIEAEPGELIGVFHHLLDGRDDYIALFACTLDAEAPPLAPEDMLEIAEARWFAPDNLPTETSRATRQRLAERTSGAAPPPRW